MVGTRALVCTTGKGTIGRPRLRAQAAGDTTGSATPGGHDFSRAVRVPTTPGFSRCGAPQIRDLEGFEGARLQPRREGSAALSQVRVTVISPGFLRTAFAEGVTNPKVNASRDKFAMPQMRSPAGLCSRSCSLPIFCERDSYPVYYR
jgi:hypothetical protein